MITLLWFITLALARPTFFSSHTDLRKIFKALRSYQWEIWLWADFLMLREGFTAKARAPDCRAPDDLETHRTSTDLWFSAPSVPSLLVACSSFCYPLPIASYQSFTMLWSVASRHEGLGWGESLVFSFYLWFHGFHTKLYGVLYQNVCWVSCLDGRVLTNNINEAPSSHSSHGDADVLGNLCFPYKEGYVSLGLI